MGKLKENFYNANHAFNYLWDYIIDLNKSGTTICLTTHYLEEAEKLCDYITIIDKGQIIKSDTKKNLMSLFGNKSVSFMLDNKITVPNELKKYNIIILILIFNLEFIY